MYFIKSRLRLLVSDDLKLGYLILVSVIGFLSGIILCVCNPDAFYYFKYTLFFAKPSIFFLLLANLIPVVVTNLILKTSLSTLCYPVFLIGGICNGYCGMGLRCIFGSGAWLICGFLMFSRFSANVLCWLLVLLRLKKSPASFRFFIFLITVITVFDYCFVAPILSEITI